MEPLCGHDAHVSIVIFVVLFDAFEICASVYDANFPFSDFLIASWYKSSSFRIVSSCCLTLVPLHLDDKLKFV